MTGIEVDLAELKNRYGALPVWGVVSALVLIVKSEKGKPL
jgi:hypothetical protein